MLKLITSSLIIAVLASCARPPSPTHTTNEPCFATTGERDYRAEVIERPPAQAKRGESVQIHFTGGYYDVIPSCERIQGEESFHYPTLDELRNRPRKVDVFLGDTPIGSFECAYDCDLLITIPDSTPLGDYVLTVRPNSWLYAARQLDFVIEITD